MKSTLKKWINFSLRKLNLKIVSAHNNILTGSDLEHDLDILIDKHSPVCIDIGANIGQTIELLRSLFEDPIIHAFEPSSKTFKILHQNCSGLGQTHLYQKGIGLETAKLPFNNLPNSQLSSFLTPVEFPWLDAAKSNEYAASQESLEVIKLDEFVCEHGLHTIDLLKSDTQGYELNVIRGAEQTLRKGNVRLVLIEMNFFEMYENQVHHIEILKTLESYGYYLIDFYEKARNPKHKATLSWCTALFGRRD